MSPWFVQNHWISAGYFPKKPLVCPGKGAVWTKPDVPLPPHPLTSDNWVKHPRVTLWLGGAVRALPVGPGLRKHAECPAGKQAQPTASLESRGQLQAPLPLVLEVWTELTGRQMPQY